MTLQYFPMIYVDELLYSVLARYQKHLGSPPQTLTNMEVLGNRLSIPSFDLQSGITYLVSKISGMTPEGILDELTIFNYLVSHASPRLSNKIRAAVLAGRVTDWYIRLGYAAFKVERVTVLRFCLKCREAMLKEQGELYWRRMHQLPSVFVCTEHRISLSKSLVGLKQVGRHAFIAADIHNCPLDAEPLVPLNAQDDDTLKRLHDLAALSEYVMQPSFQRRTLGGWATHYRRELEEVGLTTTNGHVQMERLHVGLKNFYQSHISWMPGFAKTSNLNWLNKLTRKHRSLTHPLHHLLLQYYLNCLEKDKPFGNGPWECRNPLSNHYGRKLIREYRTHRNKGHEVAVFKCKCGYVYTRYFMPSTGEIGPARFQSFGGLLESAITKLLEQGCSLRALARYLQVDPKTAVRLISNLGIKVPWRTGANKNTKVRKINQSTPQQTGQTTKPSKTVFSKIDWDAIDVQLQKRLKSNVRKIKRLKPPVKLTMAEVERQSGYLGWISKRLNKLPMTKSFLDSALETHLVYRKRRIVWAISELKTSGSSLSISNVIRKAGLRTNASLIVEDILKDFLDIRRTK